MNPRVGIWYVDITLAEGSPSQRFRVLLVGEATLEVEDDKGGGARFVNRLMFEAQMAQEGQP